jgi:hypothetical protein
MAYVIEMTFTKGAPGLYGFGDTEAEAWVDARRQVAGASGAWGPHMLRRMIGRPVPDEMASEIAEMLAADVIGWTD